MRATPRAEGTTPADEPQPAGFDLHALVLPLWMIAFSSSLVLSRGVQAALRGAFVGAGRYISPTDRAADLAAQVSGILTSLLLIHLGIRAPRLLGSIGPGLLSGLLTLLILLPLYLATRLTLPSWTTGTVTLLSALLAWLITIAPSVPKDARLTLRLSGATLGLAGLELVLAGEAAQLRVGLFGLRVLGSVLTIGALAGIRLRQHRPVRHALALGAATLLFLFGASSKADDGAWSALSARTIAALMEGAGSLAVLQWGWCWAFVSFVVNLTISRSSAAATRATLIPLLVLLCLSPPAPLVAGAFALASLTFLSPSRTG